MFKQRLIRLMRAWSLIPLGEFIRLQLLRVLNLRDNLAFKRQQPDFVVPPDKFLYETSGNVNYRDYCQYGQAIAEYYLELFRTHGSITAAKPFRILEWGCGPGRIIRHLGELGGAGVEVYGSDYDAECIGWCAAHLPRVDFRCNGLSPPLDFPEEFFDAVYCVSVFTHLSAALHRAWLAELRRVLKPGGVLAITLHGDQYRDKLLPDERAQYEEGELVVRSQVVEGSRLYAAFHPPSFVRDWLSEFEAVEHIEKPLPPFILQDQWIARKPG